MRKFNISMLVSGLILAALSGSAVGDAGISYKVDGTTPANVDANVKFKITIPQVMILRVGDWGGTINEVTWDYAFGTLGATDLVGNYAGAADRASQAQWNAATAAAGGLAATTDGTLDVSVFGNTGADLKLSVTSINNFDSTGTNANKPNLSEISVIAAGNAPTHPTFSDTDAGVVNFSDVTATNGVVQDQGTWEYKYTPASAPVGGTYNAEVQYTLAAV